MRLMLDTFAGIGGRRLPFGSELREWASVCQPAHLLTSPGLYALPAGVVALGAVGSPRAAPEWLFVFSLALTGFGILLASWAAARLALKMRSYRAEAISFEMAAQGMARAARSLFRAAQLSAIALALGLSAALALAFPGLPVLAAILTPCLAIAIAALPGAVIAPRFADAALILLVPVSALLSAPDVVDRFRVGWRFENRMAAVRSSLADRSAALPTEARDVVKALDGAGMIRPPITRLSFVSIGALYFRVRGLKAVVGPAFAVSLFAWLVAALMPPASLSVLPRPGDLWQLAPSSDAVPPDAASAEDQTEEEDMSGSGPDDAGGYRSEDDGSTAGSDGEATDGAGRENAAISSADAGTGSEEEGASGGADHGDQVEDGQTPGDGGPDSGQAGEAAAEAGSGGSDGEGAGQSGAAEQGTQAGTEAGSPPNEAGQNSGSGTADAAGEAAGEDSGTQTGGDAGTASDAGSEGGSTGSQEALEGNAGQDGASQEGGDAGFGPEGEGQDPGSGTADAAGEAAGQESGSQAGGDSGMASDAGSQGGGAGSDGASEGSAGQDGASQEGGDTASASDGAAQNEFSNGSDGPDSGSQAAGNAGLAEERDGSQDSDVTADIAGPGTSGQTGQTPSGQGDAGTLGAGDTAGGADGLPDTGDDVGTGVGDTANDQTATQGSGGPTGGERVSAPVPSRSDGAGDSAATRLPGSVGASSGGAQEIVPDAGETPPAGPDTPEPGEPGGRVLVSGDGEGAEEEGVAASPLAAERGDILTVGTPPFLFAQPGTAPPAVIRDLSPEAASDRPPGPAIPPNQRLPAWIADLFQ